MGIPTHLNQSDLLPIDACLAKPYSSESNSPDLPSTGMSGQATSSAWAIPTANGC